MGGNIWLSHDPDEVPIVRELPEDLHTPPPDYFPLDQRATFMGYRRADGRVGTRNFVGIVPASMCASHEALQISTVAEFTLYDRMKYPNVDGVVAIPHNKGCGCQDRIDDRCHAAHAIELRGPCVQTPKGVG